MRLPLRAALVAALVAAPLAVLPAAPAAAEEVYPRPADGVFQIEGHGWGHGHGLSQWGAEGAARQGVGYTQILNAYYPGTAQQALAARTIRVLIGEDDHTDVVTRPATGLAVRDLASGARYTLPSGPTRWRLVGDGAGLHVQGYNSGWSTWSTSGRSAWSGPLQFEGATPLRLYLPDGSARDYRGVLRAVRTGTSTLNVVNALDLEHYLYGVVPRESSASFQAEALKAQSVAARSYAAYKLDHVASGSTYDICSTTSCQVYGGVRLITASGSTIELEAAATTNAVNATKGVTRTYGGKAIFAEFSSSNGGWSTNGSQSYLAAKADPWDAIASPHHYWTAQVTAAQLEARYPAVGHLLRLRVTQRDGNGDWGGRVKTVVLEGVSSSGAATSVTTTGGGVYNANPWPRSAGGLRGSWWHVRATYAAAVVSKSTAPRLVRPPGAAKGDLVATVKNTGAQAWPTAGLHLAVASPLGAADPLAGGSTRPGAFAGNVTRSGASTVEPGEVAKFVVHLDASGVNAGTYARSYVVRIGSGGGFGQAVTWSVPVVNPVFTSALGSVVAAGSTASTDADAPPAVWSDGTVVVPRTGTVSLRVRIKNTGNVAWPVNGAVRLMTSDARGRESASAGSDWLSRTTVSPVTGVEGVSGATSVAPGQVGVFPLTIHGNGLAAGVTTEAFEAAWNGYHWLDGAKATLRVVRVDPAVSRLAMLHAGPAASTRLVAYPGDRRTLVIRLRNLGGAAWPVAGSEVLATANPSGRADALRTSTWLSATQPGRLAANVSRPGVAAVYPGEVGEYRVPIDPTNRAAGTYGEWFQATAGATRYGPVAGTSVSLTAAAFTGSLTRYTTGLVVPATGTATFSFDLKNTGNTVWQVGGSVRVTAPSASKTATWLTATRPGAVTGNLTRAGAGDVRPGEVARFAFTLGGNGRAPGSYRETFGVGWEAWRAMVLSVPVTYTIR
ncbi:MAG TPA: SpoIID/LytB domain-containing protein [Mycobacteriales bacterium]|jgi:SpoIID/LytB domain protein|nr:SpoIID/LytB domain-containing protein [Mycobacteriales bacterium]